MLERGNDTDGSGHEEPRIKPDRSSPSYPEKALEHQESRRPVDGAERHPDKRDEENGGEPRHDIRNDEPLKAARYRPMPDQRQIVQPTPENEIPTGPVPQAAEQHAEHQVDAGTCAPLPASSQR